MNGKEFVNKQTDIVSIEHIYYLLPISKVLFGFDSIEKSKTTIIKIKLLQTVLYIEIGDYIVIGETYP